MQPWPIIVVGLLATNVAIVALTIVAASRDPSAKIEEQYDARGQGWQQVKEERAKEQELGWQLDCKAHGRGDQTAEIKVLLYGRDGRPLKDAAVRIVAFHDARPDQVARTTLADAGLGEHVGAVSMPREGRWTVEVEAACGADTVARTFEVWISAGSVSGEVARADVQRGKALPGARRGAGGLR
jgi:nitrogen fixation protein FixH